MKTVGSCFRNRTTGRREGLSRKGVGIILRLIMGAFAVCGCVRTPSVRDAAGKTLPGSMAVVDRVSLGGVRQCISIRAANTKNPVLLYLHGGPGAAEMPLFRAFDGALEQRFTVVCWDQRGAGSSFDSKIPKESMTIDQFVSDAHELVQVLKKRFAQDKIFLVGHSWGSYLGMLLVYKYPRDFAAFIGIGQYVNGAENERISYAFTLGEAKARGNQKAIDELTRIGQPINGMYRHPLEDLLVQRKWLLEFGGALHGKNGYGSFARECLCSPEYGVFGSIRWCRGMKYSLRSMWHEVTKGDLCKQVPSVEIPVYFFMGRHDYNTPAEIVERYCAELKAPKKEVVWFEKSAHSPNYEEPLEFCRLVALKFLASP